MSPVRSGLKSQPGRKAWSRVRARLGGTNGNQTGRLGDDSGFTMVEMIVSLVIIGIVMAALGTYFVSTVSAASRQGTKQAAIQLTDDAIERVRALKGSAVVTGRDQSSSLTQWNSPAIGVAAYQPDMVMAYDSSVTSGGATATLPTVGKTTTVNGLSYTQNWYVGSCWQPLGGGACGPTSDQVAFYRVVVAVTWSDSVCANSKCSYIATTLVSNASTEPLFNSNLVAQPPKVTNPGNQISDQNVVVTAVTMASTGGAGSITWSFSGVPTGLSTTSAGVISGTPTAINTFTVIASATDSFGLVGSASFTWQIVAPPSINATDQTTVRGASVNYAPTVSGGTGSIYWDASNLPAGLTIDHGTGVISGSPTTVAAAASVILSVKDGQNQTVPKTIQWTITAPPTLTITSPGTQASGVGTAITSWAVGKGGGVSPYTWSASGYPSGLNFDTSSGTFSGTTTGPGGTYSVTVTVSDSSGQTATTSAFTWNVLAIVNPPTSISSTRNANITAVDAAAIGGTGSIGWSISSGSLPNNLSLDPATGIISGKASNSNQTYNFTLQAKDSLNTIATLAITWQVTDGVAVVTPNANQFSVAGTAITSITPTSTGGSGTTSWSVTGLPDGLSYSSGKIQGTPLASAVGKTWTVTITVTRGTGGSDSQVINWTVYAAALNITSPTTTQNSTKGTTITSFTATATGGSGYIVWSATNLPDGIALSSTGVFSGKPTTKGTKSVVITATDATGAIDPQTISWSVS